MYHYGVRLAVDPDVNGVLFGPSELARGGTIAANGAGTFGVNAIELGVEHANELATCFLGDVELYKC